MIKYSIYENIIEGLVSSQFNLYKKVKEHNYKLKNIKIYAGLYKPLLVHFNHALVFSSITGLPCFLKYQIHGKKHKRTISLINILIKQHLWDYLDKFIYQVLPFIFDFKLPSSNMKLTKSMTYTWRVRRKVSISQEFKDLILPSFFDTFKGIFLPFTTHFNFFFHNPNLYNEHFLRMFRLPFFMYKRLPHPIYKLF